MGFEPMRPKPADLKSAPLKPLGHSGRKKGFKNSKSFLFSKTFK